MKARWLMVALTAAIPTLVSAHPGHELNASFSAGITHPLLGVDHLAVMLAVGAWAAQLRARMRWLLPLSFMALLLFGAALSMSGMQLGVVEQGIAASVIVLGLLIATAVQLPISLCVTLTGCFALFHGFAHGAEAPAQASMLVYMSGFVLSTLVLHSLGFLLARTLTRYQQQVALRCSGAALAVSGVAVFVGQTLA
jgi:urease accessory protein